MYSVTLLGTGTIIPYPGRKSTAIILETGQEKILFDCGPSTPEAVVVAGFEISSIHRFFITHFHADHTLGLGHVIAAAKNDPEFPSDRRIPLYGPEGIEEFLRSWDGLYHSFGKVPSLFQPITVRGGDRLKLPDSEISVHPARHGGQPAVSYRVESGGSVFVYTGDTSFSESLVEFSRGADLIAAECSFNDPAPAGGHMTVSDVGRLASEAEPARIVLVHMYPWVDGEDARNKVDSMCRAEVIAGRDGLRLKDH